MKVALDEGVPEQIAMYLTGHEVRSVRELGLKGTLNGRLLDSIEALAFDALLSNDKKLEFEHNAARRPYRILLLSTNHRPTLMPNIDKIISALEASRPGEITRVDCGTFVPRRLRNLAP